MATFTTQAGALQSVVVRSNGATTANLTSIAVYAGTSKVVTLIDAVLGLRANIAALDQQVSWEGEKTFPVGTLIVMTLTGVVGTAVNLQFDAKYEAIADGGYLA